MKYDFTDIEKKWQKRWDEEKTFAARLDKSKKKYYALVEFPYPSGQGLHIGHPRPYTAMDIVARKRRMQGYSVLFPIGWDAFGLPTENYAIKNHIHPAIVTERNIARFTEQLKSLGLSFDWDRTINTTDPDYFKWTQWIFEQMYKDGLAKNVDMPVNWCEELGTVLANDEIIDGKSERGGYPVVRKNMKQWVLDIAKYAEKSEKLKIKAIFDSIPAQLNEKNRRFKLNSINASARHIRYEDSFNWLADAGVALPCYNVTEPQAPLQISEKRNLFKLYMNDVGLLCASCMENIQFDLLMGNVEINMGSILENAFAQNLKSNGFELHYYDSKKIGELDFVLQKGLHTELVEIKSGNDFKKHLAMDHAMKVEQWEFEQSIVFSKSNIEKEADVLYLPWYMILFFMQEKEPEKMIYEIDLSGL